VMERVKEPRVVIEKHTVNICLKPINSPDEGDDVLFVERANELRYVARLST
jgi:hypothetical protein